MKIPANDLVYCRFCWDTGRVRGLTEDLEPTIDPCVFCHPDRICAAERILPDSVNQSPKVGVVAMGLRNLISRIWAPEASPPPLAQSELPQSPFPWEIDTRFMELHERDKPGDHELLLEAQEAPGYEKHAALPSVVRRVLDRWDGWKQGMIFTVQVMPTTSPNWWENKEFIAWHERERPDPNARILPSEAARKIDGFAHVADLYYASTKHVQRRYQGVLWRLEAEGMRLCPICLWLTLPDERGKDTTCGSIPCTKMRDRVLRSVEQTEERNS